ncbi:MAG: hypothetical protein U0871_08375 [Gemmataceae bacterium]
MPASCTRYGASCTRATTPSGSGVISPFSRRTRVIWQTGHLVGQSDTTPGHIGHQYSVSAETAPPAGCEWVSLSQTLVSSGQPAISPSSPPTRSRNRSRASRMASARRIGYRSGSRGR